MILQKYTHISYIDNTIVYLLTAVTGTLQKTVSISICINCMFPLYTHSKTHFYRLVLESEHFIISLFANYVNV